MLLNSFYTILGTFYTLLNNTDLNLSYFDLSYVFPGHIDSVKRGLTVSQILDRFFQQQPQILGPYCTSYLPIQTFN